MQNARKVSAYTRAHSEVNHEDGSGWGVDSNVAARMGMHPRDARARHHDVQGTRQTAHSDTRRRNTRVTVADCDAQQTRRKQPQGEGGIKDNGMLVDRGTTAAAATVATHQVAHGYCTGQYMGAAATVLALEPPACTDVAPPPPPLLLLPSSAVLYCMGAHCPLLIVDASMPADNCDAMEGAAMA